MDIKELRQLNEEELQAKLHDAKEELFNLRIQRTLGNLQNPARFKQLRKDIARILTVFNERKRENAREK